MCVSVISLPPSGSVRLPRASERRLAGPASHKQTVKARREQTASGRKSVPPTGLLAVCRVRHAWEAFPQVTAALPAPVEAEAVLHAGGARGLRA